MDNYAILLQPLFKLFKQSLGGYINLKHMDMLAEVFFSFNLDLQVVNQVWTNCRHKVQNLTSKYSIHSIKISIKSKRKCLNWPKKKISKALDSFKKVKSSKYSHKLLVITPSKDWISPNSLNNFSKVNTSTMNSFSVPIYHHFSWLIPHEWQNSQVIPPRLLRKTNR